MSATESGHGEAGCPPAAGGTRTGRDVAPGPEPAPADAEAAAVYRELVTGTLGRDFMLGFNLGFYRTFGVPSIARVLVASGGLTTSPAVRAKATGKLMFTLFRDGLDSESGRSTLAAINGMHSRFAISQDDFRYVLACFEVAPMRWCDAHGVRATTAREKDAAHRFYLGLAERMDIRDVPESFDALAAWMDAHEREHFAPSPEAARLWAATREVLTNRAPRPLAPLLRVCTDALLDAPLRRAVGARTPPAYARALARVLLRTVRS